MLTRDDATQRIRGLVAHYQEGYPIDKVVSGEDLEEYCVAEGFLKVCKQALLLLEEGMPTAEIIKTIQRQPESEPKNLIQRLHAAWSRNGRTQAISTCLEILLEVP